MSYGIQIIGMFTGLLAFVTLCSLVIRPIREKVLGTRDIYEGLRCLLRADMLRTYYKDNETNQIRQHAKENFIFEYHAYKALGGNSFIDDIYEEVRRWEVVP